jgi:putative membrane protein
VVAWLLASHIFGLVLWISGLLVTTMALSRHTQETSPEARQVLARLERLYLRALADTGALVAILAGIGLITTSPNYYLHAGWLHMKLTLVVGVIGLHGYIAARTKAFAAGRIKMERGQARLLTVAILAIFLLILIVTLPVRVAMS